MTLNQCQICGPESTNYTIEGSLVRHIKEKHSETLPPVTKTQWQCQTCGPLSYNYKNERSLNGHTLNKHPVILLRCNTCGPTSIGYINAVALRNHIYKDHPAPLSCQLCAPINIPFVYSSRESLREHVRAVHYGGGPTICQLCGTRLRNKRSLRLHLRKRICNKSGTDTRSFSQLPSASTAGVNTLAAEGIQYYNGHDQGGNEFMRGDSSQGEDSMQDEDYQDYLQTYLQLDSRGAGMEGRDQTHVEEAPMSKEEYQAYMDSFDFDALDQMN